MSIILKRGLEANRATTAVAEGEILFSKDTGRIYIGSGSGNMGGLEIKFAQLTASGIFATDIKVTGTLAATASWAQNAVTLVGSVESSSYASTASYLLGSVESASYALTASFASTAPWSGITSKPALISASAQFTTSSNFDVGLVSASAMVVQNTEAISRITLASAGGIATADAIFVSRVSAGTLASPSATLNGHYTAWQMQSFGGSTWSTSARILMQTQGDHDETSRPTNIIFATVPSGSATLQDRLKINGSGVQVTGSLGVVGQVTAQGITASIRGNADTSTTASYVVTAQTASYVVTANTASFVTTAQTASYVVTANTASYVETANTASFIAQATALKSIQGTGINSGSAQTLVSLQSSGIYSSSAQTVSSLVGQNVALTTLTASLISASIISASLVFIDSLTVTVSTMSADVLIITTGISSSLTGSVLGTASWAVNASTASYVVTANTASYISLAAHNNAVVGTGINSGSAQTLVSLQGSNINSGSAQTLVSLQSSGVVSSSLQFSNTSVFNVGTITASNALFTNLNVTTISSSIEYASGSNIFGTNQTNTHRFTGSVSITGSLNITGYIYSTGNGTFEGDTSFGNSSTGKTTQFLSAGAVLTITPNNSTGLNGVVYDTSFISGNNGPHIFQIGSIEKVRVASTGIIVTGSITNTQGIGWGILSTATATATSSLSSTSAAVQVFTGTLTQQVNLPAANLLGAGIGVMYVIKNRSTGIVTVKAAGADLIDGAATATLNTTTSVTLVSNGVSEWEII